MIFFDPEEWAQHRHSGSVKSPMHYVGILQRRANEAWLERYDFRGRHPDLYFFSTMDGEEIRVSDLPPAMSMLGPSRAQILRSIKRPEASLEFIVASLERASPGVRVLLSNCEFGTMPAPMVNAGVQPSPCGGTVVMVQDGVFMSPWAYGRLDGAVEAAQMLIEGDSPEEKGARHCWEMLYASLCMAGQVAGPSILEEASRGGRADLSSMDRALGKNWPASEVYGDGRSVASSLCGMLAVFIVAHEIGHIALGHAEASRRILLGQDSPTPLAPAELHRREYEADRYAIERWLEFTFAGGPSLGSSQLADPAIYSQLADSLFYVFLPLAIAERASADSGEPEPHPAVDEGGWAMTGGTHPPWDSRFENVLSHLSAGAKAVASDWRRKLADYSDAVIDLAAEHDEVVPMVLEED